MDRTRMRLDSLRMLHRCKPDDKNSETTQGITERRIWVS